MLIGASITHRRLLKGEFSYWVTKDIGMSATYIRAWL
jgi:hypothetical protein